MKPLLLLLAFPSFCFSAALADLKVSPTGGIGGTFFDTVEITPSLFKSANSIQGTLVAGTDYLAPTGNGSGLTGLTKSQVSLGNVENTALSTWGGSINITTLGTISTGVWNGTAIGNSYISSAATWNAKEPAISAGTTGQYWRGDKSWQTLNSAAVGLGSVENTALSTWAGTNNITTLGVISSGTWASNAIAVNRGGTGAVSAANAFDNLAPTTTQGDIIFRNASANARLAKGTALQVLQMNAGATAPEWATPAAGGVSSITGTANQVVASASTGAVTLSLPQSIGTASAVQFGTVSVGTSATTGTHTIQGVGTTTGKSLVIRNSSGTTTAYIQDSGAASMGVNTVTGGQAFAAGNNNTASGVYSIALGDSNTASSTSNIAIGSACVSSGINAIALGANCSATGAVSLCTGFRTIASRRGQRSFSGDGYYGADGAAQGIELTLQVKTTNATATTLWLNGASQGANVRFNLQSGYVVSGILTVHGIKSDGSAVAMFVRQISYKNVGGTSSAVFSPVTIGTDNASGCALTFLNPDTNDAIEPQVTGIAAETWRWTASFQGVETAYGN